MVVNPFRKSNIQPTQTTSQVAPAPQVNQPKSNATNIVVVLAIIFIIVLFIFLFRKKIKGFFQRRKKPVLIITGIILVLGIGILGIHQFNKQTRNQNQQISEIQKMQQEINSLQNKKPQVIIKNIPAPQTNDFASIAKQWRPRIAYIDCKVVTNGTNYGEQSGSGYLLGEDTTTGELGLLTNKHVIKVGVNNIYGQPSGLTMTATSCDIMVPGDSQYVTVYSDSLAPNDAEDIAIIFIKNPTPYMTSVITGGTRFCTKTAALGEQLLVLGYPGIGSQTDVTVTDGIVSGYDGNYYITSAKVEHGNSGGAAISVKNNCYLGIPSYVDVGSVESLARIYDVTKLP